MPWPAKGVAGSLNDPSPTELYTHQVNQPNPPACFDHAVLSLDDPHDGRCDELECEPPSSCSAKVKITAFAQDENVCSFRISGPPGSGGAQATTGELLAEFEYSGQCGTACTEYQVRAGGTLVATFEVCCDGCSASW